MNIDISIQCELHGQNLKYKKKNKNFDKMTVSKFKRGQNIRVITAANYKFKYKKLNLKNKKLNFKNKKQKNMRMGMQRAYLVRIFF